MKKIDKKWVDVAKALVKQYAESATEQDREIVLNALADEGLMVLEAMVQYCAGIDDWMPQKEKTK